MSEPALIKDDTVPWEPYPALEGAFRIKRTVSRGKQGSESGMGICELQPGQSTVWWSFIDDDPDTRTATAFGASAHETHFVLKGRFTFHWQGDDGAQLHGEAGPGDSFYFAPGRRCRVENTRGHRCAVSLDHGAAGGLMAALARNTPCMTGEDHSCCTGMVSPEPSKHRT